MKYAKIIGAILVLVAAIVYKFQLVLSKLGALMKLGVVLLALLHLSSGKDSTAFATNARAMSFLQPKMNRHWFGSSFAAKAGALPATAER